MIPVESISLAAFELVWVLASCPEANLSLMGAGSSPKSQRDRIGLKGIEGDHRG